MNKMYKNNKMTKTLKLKWKYIKYTLYHINFSIILTILMEACFVKYNSNCESLK